MGLPQKFRNGYPLEKIIATSSHIDFNNIHPSGKLHWTKFGLMPFWENTTMSSDIIQPGRKTITCWYKMNIAMAAAYKRYWRSDISVSRRCELCSHTLPAVWNISTRMTCVTWTSKVEIYSWAKCRKSESNKTKNKNSRKSSEILNPFNPLRISYEDSLNDGFDPDGDLVIYKIGDLGHVTSVRNPQVEDGDCRYLSKEAMNGKYNHLIKADMFSLGMTLYEAGGGGPLPKNGTEWHKLRDGFVPDLKGLSRDFNNLIKVSGCRSHCGIKFKMVFQFNSCWCIPIQRNGRHQHKFSNILCCARPRSNRKLNWHTNWSWNGRRTRNCWNNCAKCRHMNSMSNANGTPNYVESYTKPI